jgi:group I intron endonuclease
VGSSFNVRKRLGEHANALRRGRHINHKLANCCKSYGIGGMEFAIAQECSTDLLIETETKWIVALNSYKRGLNCAPSANGTGRRASAATRLKIGEKSRGRSPSTETRKLLSIASRNQSPESRAAAAAKRKGRPKSREAILKCAIWHTGKKRSAEAIFNISKSLAKINEEGSRVIFGMITEGFTYNEIAEKFGVSRQTICNLRKGKTICLRGSAGPAPELTSNYTEATRQRRSNAQRGRVTTAQAKMRMSQARRGVAKSEEHKAAIRDALKKHHAEKRLRAEIERRDAR